MRTAQFEKALLLGAVALGLTACASASQTTPGSAYGPATASATATASDFHAAWLITAAGALAAGLALAALGPPHTSPATRQTPDTKPDPQIALDASSI